MEGREEKRREKREREKEREEFTEFRRGVKRRMILRLLWRSGGLLKHLHPEWNSV